MKKVLLWLLACCLLIGGCRYDAGNIRQKLKSKRIVSPVILQEVKRLKSLYEKAFVYDKERNLYLPVTYAFNDSAAPGEPVQGGRIRTVMVAEPKRLTHLMDTSSVTSQINQYIFNCLLYRDPATLEFEPDLALSYSARDIVWLKGTRQDSIFPRDGKENNDYLVCSIPENGVKSDADGTIREIRCLRDGRERVIPLEQLRLKSNPDGSYKRYFDRQVVITFALRRDVRWHDGEPFSAEDVIFTIDTIKNPKIPEMTSFRSNWDRVHHYEAIDDYTVVFYFEEQYFKAIEIFDTIILPKHVFITGEQTFNQETFAKYFRDHPALDEPVGTGPYALPSERVLPKYRRGGEGWQAGNYIHLVRTGDFYDPKRSGFLEDIYFYIITDNEAILRALLNNEIDAAPRGLGSEDIFKKSNSDTFRQNYVKGFYYTGNFLYICFNQKKPYFMDKRVRKAFTHLLPKRELLENLSYGVGQLVTGSQYIFGPVNDRSIKPLGFDMQKAVDLLNQAGWVDTDLDGIRDKNGIPLKVEFLASQGSSLATSIYGALSENCAQVGIDFTIQRMEWASLLEHIDDRKFDMYSLAWTTPIESDPYDIWHSSQWLNKGQNTGGFDSPEVDRLIEAYRRELDLATRRTLWSRIQHIIHDQQPYIFLYCYPSRFIYSKQYRNVRFYSKRPGYFLWEWYKVP